MINHVVNPDSLRERKVGVSVGSPYDNPEGVGTMTTG
jgi:hypothetical protein